MQIDPIVEMIKVLRAQEVAEKYENYVFHLCDKEPFDWSTWEKFWEKETTDENHA